MLSVACVRAYFFQSIHVTFRLLVDTYNESLLTCPEWRIAALER